ncbi:MAG: RNA methyltransferase, partial [Bacteroidia bacterium]|nr:RNA methyltransferase [Bacteroidia bacterium]
MVDKEITSLQNPLIKEIFLLQEKSRARKRSATFIIEGKREITLALKGNYEFVHVLICESIFDISSLNRFSFDTSKLIKISKDVYQKIAHRSSTEGIIAVAKCKELDLQHIVFKNKSPLILVAEAPEKPGNIGALLRTADAANLDAVLIANPKTDMYNPNIIRSSVGCLFTNQIATGTTADIINFLKDHDIKIYCADLKAAEPYYNIDYSGATAII